MACSCNSFPLQRVLYKPVTELDKLEHQLVEASGYRLELVPDWKDYSFLAAYASLDPASQSVLAAQALKQLGLEDRAESLGFLAGLQYPLTISLLVEFDLTDLLNRALANRLTEKELVGFLNDSVEDS